MVYIYGLKTYFLDDNVYVNEFQSICKFNIIFSEKISEFHLFKHLWCLQISDSFQSNSYVKMIYWKINLFLVNNNSAFAFINLNMNWGIDSTISNQDRHWAHEIINMFTKSKFPQIKIERTLFNLLGFNHQCRQPLKRHYCQINY